MQGWRGGREGGREGGEREREREIMTSFSGVHPISILLGQIFVAGSIYIYSDWYCVLFANVLSISGK